MKDYLLIFIVIALSAVGGWKIGEAFQPAKSDFRIPGPVQVVDNAKEVKILIALVGALHAERDQVRAYCLELITKINQMQNRRVNPVENSDDRPDRQTNQDDHPVGANPKVGGMVRNPAGALRLP